MHATLFNLIEKKNVCYADRVWTHGCIESSHDKLTSIGSVN